MTHNSALGLRVGIPKDKFDALADYKISPLLCELEHFVIRYAEEMTRRVQVDADLVEELKCRLSPEAVVQLTLSIAAANLATDLET